MSSRSLWLDPRTLRWPVGRLKDHVTLINGFPFDSSRFNSVRGTPVVRIRDLLVGKTETYFDGPTPSECLVRPGDLLVGMDGDFNTVVWRGEAAALNQRICLLRASGKSLDQRFLAHLIGLPLKAINDITYFTTVKHLSSIDLMEELVPLPPISEQRIIANFLDAQTARIDALIAAKHRMAGLIGERFRVVVVTECRLAERSTDGRRLGSFATVTLGRQRSPEHESGPFMTPYLRAANVKDGLLDLSDVKEMNFMPGEQALFQLKAGDVLITEGAGSLAAVGTSAVWNAELEGTICFQNTLLRVRPRRGLDLQYLAWWCRGAYYSGLLSAVASGANIYHISADRLKAVPCAIPSIDEQHRICHRLAIMQAASQTAVSTLRQQVELLHERRRALITAAVTGKLNLPAAA